MAKHTAGEWTVGGRGPSGDIQIKAPSRPGGMLKQQIVARVAGTVGYLADPAPEAEANARVVAAAPDLLAALEALLDDQPYQEQDDGTCECGDGDSIDCVHQRARKAIARAKGEG